MTNQPTREPEGFDDTGLKFCRHPYYPASYAALGADHVRVEIDAGDWGEFDRNARWIDGPLRHADPIFCRWVTSEIKAEAAIARAGGG